MLEDADFDSAIIQRILCPGANLRRARLANADLTRCDLSGCDLEDADLTGVIAARCTFLAANLKGVCATDAVLEFSNFRDARLIGTRLHRTSLVGADFAGAVLHGVDLRESDLYWTALTPDALSACRTDHARWPEPVVIKFGPRNAAPPEVQPKPLYPAALTEAERRERARQRPGTTIAHG